MRRFLTLVLFLLSMMCMFLFIAACSSDEVVNDETPDSVSEDSIPEHSVQDLPETAEDPSDEAVQTTESENNTDENVVEEIPEVTENEVEEAVEEVRLEAIPLKIVDEEPDWNADYNKPKVDLEDIVPGLVAQNVYVGHDGWMFYGGTIKDYTEECTYSDNRLNFLSKKLIERLNFCEENGIKLYFVVTPNKNSVYPEYMATEGVEMAENRTLDVILNYLSENTELNVIDCRKGLFAAKEQYPDENLYYKLDTHWNNHGGFAAYTQIMEAVSKDFPNAVTYTKDDYQIDYFDSYMKDEA